ncbi:hypothetical protein [Bradyrhizobium liaoningense]|uniref:hypothetical protein n=1 Tax=Bradyrhizobium liaoningense TaxID=43992 RepID=UPI001BA60C4A|nr:hypothetical protein [Bradyrhizobium liaoningense]MBR0855639.1 hypothetical protein [Bradyrhizobium liaoningense]
MIVAKILISIALVFTALSLACAVTFGRRARHAPAKPSFGYTRAELEAMTARAEERRWADPLGLRRPLFFSSVRLPSAGEADGGDQVHPGFPAVRYFRLIRGDRDV